MRLSIRYRLLLPLVLLLIGDAAATAWAAAAAARRAEERLAAQQWAVAGTLAEPRSTFPLTGRVLEQMRGLSGAEFLFIPVVGPHESTLDPVPPPPADMPTTTRPHSGETHSLGPAVDVAGNQYRCLRLSLRPPHPNAGGSLYILYPESLRQTAVRDAVRPLLVLGGAGGLVAVGLAFAFGSRLVVRVRDLEARTRLIAAGDLRPMPIPPGQDELTDLCTSVNDMALRLAEFQDRLQRTERLRVLGQFAGGLAHQLRNAATGAKLAVELFIAENPQADPEPLEVALRQLARIEANLRQFLDLGKPPVEVRQTCDVSDLIGQTVSLLGPQAQHTGTSLVWQPPAGEFSVTADPTGLLHVFGNTIGNAVEAAGPGGRVEVRGPTYAPAGRILVEVVDTGPGPPPEIAEKIFEPFVTGKEQGIGLGLAAAKQTVDAAGGSIAWIRTGGHTVFRIVLPAAAGT